MTDPADASATPEVFAPGGRFGKMSRLLVSLAAIGWLVAAVAWLLPFDTSNQAGIYDGFATVAFFARVFPLPQAIGWGVLTVLAVIVRRRWLGLACLLSAIAWAAPEAWMAWPRATSPATGPTFSVASFNLEKDLRDATWAGQVMRSMNADVVALQELSPHSAEQLKAGLADVYPFAAFFPDAGYNGMGVLSKMPLTVLHPPADYEHRDLSVSTTVDGREIVLVDVHLAPPQQIAKRRLNRWQVPELLGRLSGETRPTLMAGDYNATALTPQAFAIRTAGFADAQLQAGHGRHTSWPAGSAKSIVPKVRIDTVYARGPLRAIESVVGPDIGSDHLPIKTTWAWER